MRIQGKTVMVCGAGISGIGCIKLLKEENVNIILFDNGKNANIDVISEKLEREGIKKSLVNIVVGELSDELVKTLDIAVLSPGIPTDQPFVLKLKEAGVPIWGEIELAYEFSKGTLVGITGTNGKTTTTALSGEIMADYYESVFVVGNIGKSFASQALKTKENSVIVAELSSFQLETIQELHPHVSAVLNITPDHLDRHKTMEAYMGAKENVMMNQTEEDSVVLNYMDPETRRMAGNTKAKAVWFSSCDRPPVGYYLKGDEILKVDGDNDIHIIYTNELQILGKHNMENVMAALAIGEGMNVPLESIIGTLKRFKGVEHRIEYVVEKNGVVFYNDSKGTNTDAAIKAVEAMVRPTIVIGGGYDKHVEFDDWVESFGDKVKLLVLIGQTSDKIEECCKKHGYTNVIKTDSLEDAVKISYNHAEPGYAVLLSPACASWGMFDNYEQRGRMFKDIARAL